MAGAMVFQQASGKQPQPSEDKVLLIRRAASDSYPLKWELPGGSVDTHSDATVLAAAARELWEETGLRASHLLQCVGMLLPEEEKNEDEEGTGTSSLTTAIEKELGITPALEDAQMDVSDPAQVVTFLETGRMWGKVVVFAEVESTADAAIVLRPEEHAEWAWATEREAKMGMFENGGVKSGAVMGFVSDGMRRTLLQGFRLRRQMRRA